MKTSKYEKPFAMIAGICFLICLIGYVLFYIGTIEFKDILNLIFYCGMAVFMFLRKKNVGILFVIGAGLLVKLSYVFGEFKLTTFGIFVAYLVFFVFFLTHVIPSMSRFADATEKLIFVPGVLYLISSIRSWVASLKIASLSKTLTAVISSDYISYSDVILQTFIPGFALIVGFVMAGLWLKETRRIIRIEGIEGADEIQK